MAGFSVKHRELLDTGTDLEFTKLNAFLKAFLLREHNEDGTHITDDPTSGVAPSDGAYVMIGNTSSLSDERALVGTTNQISVTDNGAGSTVVLATPQSIHTGASPTFVTATLSGLTATRIPIAGVGGLLADDADLTFVTDTLTSTKMVASTNTTLGGAAAAATTLFSITKKVTGIADNTATNILTVTIPNANHAGALRLMLLSSNGSTDAFESNRAAQGLVVFQRNTGVVAVATAAAIADGVIATNATGGSATHTLAYNVSAVTGAADASNTFTIQVTIDDSGNLGSNQLVLFAELLNTESTGITIA